MTHIESLETYAEFTSFPVTDIGIQYPNTQENKKLRLKYFGEEPVDHPSKNEVSLIQDIYRYVSKPGDTLLDPMAGTGSLMLAATEGREVILIEMEQELSSLQQRNRDILQQPNMLGTTQFRGITILQGDCRDYLQPNMTDHIITSPPYGRTQTSTKDLGKGDALSEMKSSSGWQVYQNPKNLAIMKDNARYQIQMEKIYKLYGEAVRPGGTVTIIIGDETVNKKRKYHSNWAFQTLLRNCPDLYPWRWFKRHRVSTFTMNVNRAKGAGVIEDEDIIIMRKER